MYAQIRDQETPANIADIVNSAWTTYASGSVANYDLQITDRSGSYYTADLPTWVAANTKMTIIYREYASGTTPTESDIILGRPAELTKAAVAAATAVTSSDVQVVNMALVQIGEQPITALTDDTPRAKAANVIYADLRDTVLSAFPWLGATKRVRLAQLTSTPLFGFTKEYQLPSDYLRLLRVDGNPDFRIEGRKIVSDDSTIQILYIYQISDIVEMSTLFRQSLAARLACDLASNLRDEERMATTMWELYRLKIAEAKFVESTESPDQAFETRTWTGARTSGDEPYRRIDV